MVEASKELREAQKTLLCGPGVSLTESEVGQQSKSKYGGTPIVWSETVKSIPKGRDRHRAKAPSLQFFIGG